MPPKVKKDHDEEATEASQLPLPMKRSAKPMKKPAKPKISKLEIDLLKLSEEEMDEVIQRVRNQRTLEEAAIGMTSFTKKPSTTLLEELELDQLRYELGELLQKQVELRAREKKVKQTIKRKQRNIILAHQFPSLQSLSSTNIVSKNQKVCVAKTNENDIIILDEDDKKCYDENEDHLVAAISGTTQLSSAIDKLFPNSNLSSKLRTSSTNVSSSNLLWDLNRSIDLAATVSQRVDISRDCTLQTHFDKNHFNQQGIHDHNVSFTVIRNYSTKSDSKEVVRAMTFSTVKEVKHNKNIDFETSDKSDKEHGDVIMEAYNNDAKSSDDKYDRTHQLNQWKQDIQSIFTTFVDRFCEHSESKDITTIEENLTAILEIVRTEWLKWKHFQLQSNENELETIQQMISFLLSHFLPQYFQDIVSDASTYICRDLTVFSCLLDVIRHELLSLHETFFSNKTQNNNICTTKNNDNSKLADHNPLRIMKYIDERVQEENVIVLDSDGDDNIINLSTQNINENNIITNKDNDYQVIQLLSPSVSPSRTKSKSVSSSQPQLFDNNSKININKVNESPILPLFERLQHIKHRFQQPLNSSLEDHNSKQSTEDMRIITIDYEQIPDDTQFMHKRRRISSDTNTIYGNLNNMNTNTNNSSSGIVADRLCSELGIDVLPALQQQPVLVQQYIDRLQQRLYMQHNQHNVDFPKKKNANAKSRKIDKSQFLAYAEQVIVAFVRHPAQRILYNRMLLYEVIDIEQDVIIPAHQFYGQYICETNNNSNSNSDILVAISPDVWKRVFTVDTIRQTFEKMHVFHKVTQPQTKGFFVRNKS